jgi:dihydrofolate synthase/folylpolyglutamate synthase
MDLGLGRMRRALAALGIGHPARTVVQVVGTNGKGATATLVAALCAAHGLSCGLFTSPHFLSVRERIRRYRGDIPGAAATPGAPLGDGYFSESAWLDAARAVLAATAPFGDSGRLTYFELVTVMAAQLFASRGVDVAVFEAGLGGSHDATTALHRDMVVYTPIGMDHAGVLGPALADIARDKAGAIPGAGLAVTGPQTPGAMAELAAGATDTGLPLLQARDVLAYDAAAGVVRPLAVAGPVIEAAPLGLPGAFQAENAATALAAFFLLAEKLRIAIRPEAVRRALGETRLPGRMQRLRPPGAAEELLLDCAHNVPAMLALEAACAAGGVSPAAVIFTCLADKDFEGMAGIVRRLTTGPIVVPGLSCPGRTRHPADVARGLGERAVAVPDVAAALTRVRDVPGTVVVCGSMYLLAEVMGRPGAS